jgi:hypothetical protein
MTIDKHGIVERNGCYTDPETGEPIKLTSTGYYSPGGGGWVEGCPPEEYWVDDELKLQAKFEGLLKDKLWKAALAWQAQGARSKWSTTESLALWDAVEEIKTTTVDEALIDLLSLVLDEDEMKKITPEVYHSWSNSDRSEIEFWAARVHLRASDNDVHVPDRPEALYQHIACWYCGDKLAETKTKYCSLVCQRMVKDEDETEDEDFTTNPYQFPKKKRNVPEP